MSRGWRGNLGGKGRWRGETGPYKALCLHGGSADSCRMDSGNRARVALILGPSHLPHTSLPGVLLGGSSFSGSENVKALAGWLCVSDSSHKLTCIHVHRDHA